MSLAGATAARSQWISCIDSNRLWWPDFAIVVLLASLSVLLFRSHVFGDGLYIGNPDRLNSNLKILKFYLNGLGQGHLDAWSDFEMLGYDTFTLPYTFPNPFTFVAYLLGPSNLYVVAGYEVVFLLALAGISAYAFIRSGITDVFAAAIAAVLYEFSALTLLKVSQNDMSFAVFIIIPMVMLVIRKTEAKTSRRGFYLLSGLIFFLLYFTFLQKASYALLLAGSYALYRGISTRDWRVIVVFGSACIVGFVGAFPRLYGIADAMKEYSRLVSGMDFKNFTDVYHFQSVFPEQILRWFDDTIFGAYPSDAVNILGNGINLTEGFLLYTSSLVPFLFIFNLLRYGNRSFGLTYSLRDEGGFFFWFLMFTFSVIAFPIVLKLIWLLYFRLDFTHARILIIGLLPLSVVVGLFFVDIKPSKDPAGLKAIIIIAVAAIVAVLIVIGIERFAHAFRGNTLITFPNSITHVRHSAIARIGLSAAVVGFLILGIKQRLPFQSWLKHSLPFLGDFDLASCFYYTLGLAIGIHTFVGANFQVNDSHTSTPPSFLGGNIYYSSKENFHPPTPDLIAKVRQRFENDKYRVALLCDPNIAGGFCAGDIPEFWRLRAVDGYYGLGVPTRLASLPWGAGLSLRTISFTNPDNLPWPILSLLNVKYAVRVSEAFYRNNSGGPNDTWRAMSPDDIKFIKNPLAAVSRYFFARHLVPVQTAQEAASKLFNGDSLIDVNETSFVENLSGNRDFSDVGAIALAGFGDSVTLRVDPAPNDRFLVLNELYFPGWSATIDGKAAPIYPTNAVMRGVVVPAGAIKIDFTYTPVTRSGQAIGFYLAGLILAGIGGLAFGRHPLHL